MYSHPAAAEFNARYHQEELLRDARNARLAREAHAGDEHTTTHHAVVAAAVALLLVVATFLVL